MFLLTIQYNSHAKLFFLTKLKDVRSYFTCKIPKLSAAEPSTLEQLNPGLNIRGITTAAITI